jgi:hypothetical protein
MVVHKDEHAIIKAILLRALGDDDCFATVVSADGSESRRAEDRLVLAKFLVRMERQFELRAESWERRGRSNGSSVSLHLGSPPQDCTRESS